MCLVKKKKNRILETLLTRSSQHTLYRAVFAADWSIDLEFVCHWRCTSKFSKRRTSIWFSIVLNGHGQFVFFKVISFAVIWLIAVLELQKDSAINNLIYGQILCVIKNEMSHINTEFQVRKSFVQTLYKTVFCSFIENDKPNAFWKAGILNFEAVWLFSVRVLVPHFNSFRFKFQIFVNGFGTREYSVNVMRWYLTKY